MDKYILEKSSLISYTQAELSNIAASSNHLRGIINNQSDFNESFIGGSYKRATMVKGISDVDIYYQYTGTGNPQTALQKLKNCLTTSYPNSDIKQDKPSILVAFDRIPFNITPFKRGQSGGTLEIPNTTLTNWQLINFGQLEVAITALRNKNPKLIDLIKILKLWNKNYNKGLKNFEIEQKVCNLFSYTYSPHYTILDFLRIFFQNNNYIKEALFINDYLCRITDEKMFKTEWLKFIDNEKF